MPTYDYVCDACDHKFEHFQGMNDALLKKCPVCKKSKLRRLIGAGAAIMFKGSGFYTTDYRSDSYNKAAAADKTASGGDSKPADSKPAESTSSESKPAAKTESKSAAKQSKSKD